MKRNRDVAAGYSRMVGKISSIDEPSERLQNYFRVRNMMMWSLADMPNTIPADQYPKMMALEKWVSLQIEVLKVVVDEPKQPPLSCPGLPWWQGTEGKWRAWLKPLQERDLVIVKDGRPVWMGSATLARMVALAAVEKRWLARSVGNDGPVHFLQTYFAWPKKTPKRNSFYSKSGKRSGKTDDRGEAILKEYGFSKDDILALSSLK